MDWEAPADAWYVWLAVSILSLTMAGIVLGLPTGPPPDAERTTNAIDETSGSTYEAASTLSHDADAVKVNGTAIELRNEHGTDYSSTDYGPVVAVNGHDRLERLVYGEDFEAVFEDELEDPDEDAAAVFMDRVAEAEENNSGEWLTASEELTARQIAVEPDLVPGIYVEVDSFSDEKYDPDVDYIDENVTIPASVAISVEGFERFDGSKATDYTFEGDHIPAAGPNYEAENTFYHSGSKDVTVRLYQQDDDPADEDSWGGNFPLQTTVKYDDRTCERTLLRLTGETALCSQGTTAEERADELDWIELNDETEDYRATLVVV